MLRVVAIVLAVLAFAPAAQAATLTVSAPKGVPATVSVGKRVLAKPPAGRSKRFKVAGGRVRAQQFTFDGVTYGARVSRTRVVYRALPAAKRLHADAVEQTSISLAWTAPAHAVVALRRTVGERPARSVRAGVKVATRRGSAVDRGLKPDTKYSYALFTKTRGGWIGPLTIAAGTASSNPAVAAYVAPSSTVIAGAADKPTLNAQGVSVALAPRRPAPLVGAGFVLPVSAGLPAGYLGKVASVSADGRTVQLVSGSFADAFDYYDVHIDLSQTGAIKPRAHASQAAECPGASGERNVTLHPIITPSGHFDGSIVKKWIVPVGAKFDLSVSLQVGMSADIDVSAAVECGLSIHEIHTFPTEPVPIVQSFEHAANTTTPLTSPSVIRRGEREMLITLQA